MTDQPFILAPPPVEATKTKPKRTPSAPVVDAEFIYLAFGGGVQSTALLLLWANRDPRLGEVLARKFGPDAWPRLAIFADTGDEPEATYQHLWSMAELCEARGLWLEVVHRDPDCKPMSQALLEGDARRPDPPMYERTSVGVMRDHPPMYLRTEKPKRGMIRRQCTGAFKIDPINRRLRELLGVKAVRDGRKVGVLLGISTDEMERADESVVPWIVTHHPLLWMGWSRNDCVRYLESQGFPNVPKSACVFCPFRRDAEWARMKAEAPRDFERACAFDDAFREVGVSGLKHDRGRGALYVHGSLLPLREVSFATPQLDLLDANDAPSECTGHCFM